jgi:hypothetical protein
MGVGAAIVDAHFVFMTIKFGDEHLRLERPSGVYKIIINDHWYYIGSSNNLRSRLSSWRCMLQGATPVKNRSIRHLLPQIKTVRFAILKYTKVGEDPKVAEDTYIKKHFDDKKCLNLSPTAYSPKMAGVRKLPIVYVPKIKPIKIKGPVTPRKKVAQFDLSGNLIKIHESIAEASRSSGVKDDVIRKVFNGRSVRPTNFIFKGVSETGSFIEPTLALRLSADNVRFIVENYRTLGNSKLRTMFGMSETAIRNVASGKTKSGVLCGKYNEKMPPPAPKKVIRISAEGREILFKSIGEAARSTGSKASSVQRALLPGNEHRRVGGYQFRYA